MIRDRLSLVTICGFFVPAGMFLATYVPRGRSPVFINPFHEKLIAHGVPLTRGRLETLQINVSRKCNQTCSRCHVDAGPQRSEMMTEEVARQVAAWIREHRPKPVDITGGAPEISEVFLVFGPAADGGYDLVGLSRPCPAIFRNIEWGGPRVLIQTLAAALDSGFHTSLLEVLSDVDVPEDLSSTEAVRTSGTSLAVIVPALNEELRLAELLDRLKLGGPHEISLADGGGDDRTMEIAPQVGVHVITRLLQSPATSAGAFRFQLAGDLPGAPLIESVVNLRCRLLGTPYGGQGLSMRRRIFRHLGGYPDWPVMEDRHLVRQLNRLAAVRTAPEAARTATRRWANGGPLRTFPRHQRMLAAYHPGAPAEFIARLHP